MHGAARCRMHGGARSGRPEKHGLYSRHLKPEQLEAFAEARAGDLEREIRLAKAKLDWCVSKWADDPDGGVVIGHTEYGNRIEPWSEIVGVWTERVRKLEATRSEMLQRDAPAGDGVDGPELVVGHRVEGVGLDDAADPAGGDGVDG